MTRWIEFSDDGGLPLVAAVGEQLKPDLIEPALQLLRSCDPPNNHALYQFITRNSGQFGAAQRRSTLSLVTWPERGPERLGDVLGGVALRHFPSSPEVAQMWTRWIWAGAFDGTPCAPSALAREFALAEQEGVAVLNQLNEALRSHVRGYLRSGDERKVVVGVDHLMANVNEKTAAVAALCRETSGVSGTAEWADWEERDRATADRMRHYVFAFLQEAESDGNWTRAFSEFERALEFDAWRRQRLADGGRGGLIR